MVDQTTDTGQEAAGATESGPTDEQRQAAAAALAWLDATLEELRGALTACGAAIDTGALAGEAVSGRMNALVMQMMGGGA